MRAEFQDNNPVGVSGRKDKTSITSLSSTGPLLARDVILGRARQTTWRIYQQCRDPDAIALLEEAKRPRDGAVKVAERFELALAEWCQANQTRAEFCAILATEFRHRSETGVAAVKEVRLSIENRCLEFAVTKYGDNEEARELGRMLGLAAWSALDVSQMPMAIAAFAILQHHERKREELKRDRQHAIDAELAEAEKANENDPILDLLRKFFSIDDGYWLRFFDKRDQPRRKKRPYFPSMRERLVKSILTPEKMGLSPNAQTITCTDAYELAAVCMKAAYPGLFPKSLDGESARLAIRYHDRIAQHPAAKPRRYGLV